MGGYHRDSSAMAARSKNELKSLTCLRIPPVKLDELACSDTRDTSSSRLASSASFCAARESSGASLPCSTASSTSCMREDASRQYYNADFVSIHVSLAYDFNYSYL